MLLQVEAPTGDFFALATYLIHGKERPTNPNRVDWVQAHNLVTDDPMLAAKIMTATAEQSRRCKAPCLHATINWRVDEEPSPEIMQEITRRTLEMAGLADHQALVMAHADKQHRHAHFMINRVHPDTGKAYDLFQSHRRFDRIMKELSAEYGFLYVPCHAFEPDLTDTLPKNPNSNATYAAKRGAKTDRMQWSRKHARTYGAEVSQDIDQATSWEDLEYRFAQDRLFLEPKGQGKKSGLIVGDGTAYTKFSALKLKASAKGLAKKFGGAYRGSVSRPPLRHIWTPPPPSRNVWTVDEIDLARALGSKDQLKAAVREAVRVRKARIAKKTFVDQLREDLKETFKASTMLNTTRSKKQRPKPVSSRAKQSHPTEHQR